MRKLIGLLVGMFFSFSAVAGIRIVDATVTPSASGENSATLQFVITSTAPSTLIGVSSPIAESSEFQSVTQENGVMKTQAVDSIGLIPGKTYNMAVSGKRVVLHNLKQPLKRGDKVPFTLTVQSRNQSNTSQHMAKVLAPPADHANESGSPKTPGM